MINNPLVLLVLLIPTSFGGSSETDTLALMGKEVALKKLDTILQQVEELKTLAVRKLTGDEVMCGLNGRTTRNKIIDGHIANPGDWPWMAAITNTSGALICGGTLITKRHVLTAAHCFVRYGKDNVIVRLGEHILDDGLDNNRIDFNVDEVRKHEGYVFLTNENDIALLKLDRLVTFGEYIKPACLPPPNNDFDTEFGYVIGWGHTHFFGFISEVLREVTLPIWNQSSCIQVYSAIQKVFPTMLCAGARMSRKDSCQGDSGGPLLVQILPRDIRWYVAGIVSFGTICGHPTVPGVYTRVNMYLKWIKENSAF